MTDQTDPYESRRGLTFAQAEGAAPIPSQLALGELSRSLRVKLDSIMTGSMEANLTYVYQDHYKLSDSWREIIRRYSRNVLSLFDDEVNLEGGRQVAELRTKFRSGTYIEVLDFVQFCLQYFGRSSTITRAIDRAFIDAKAAYRVVDDLIVPASTEAEAESVQTAFANLARENLLGARQHLENASRAVNAGEWADAVRESVHAVESVAKKLDPSSSTLGPALTSLGKAHAMHPALIKGMSSIYGYTSDQEGIRHALIDDSQASVDEADALYMFGACAAFVTYLVTKGRTSGLLGTTKN